MHSHETGPDPSCFTVREFVQLGVISQRTPVKSIYRTLLLGIGLLVLSACGGDERPIPTFAPFTDFDAYELTYTSTCGDGDNVTEGTTIRFADGDVTVLDGEEPANVGSIGVWNFTLENAAAGGLLIEEVRGPMGEPVSFDVRSRRLAFPDICVAVSDFSVG